MSSCSALANLLGQYQTQRIKQQPRDPRRTPFDSAGESFPSANEIEQGESIMLDIKFVRENPDAVKENIKKFQDAKAAAGG